MYFCSIFLTMFPTTVSSVQPTLESYIFLHNMESIRIIRRKEIWSGQSNNIVYRGNIDGSWEQIWRILGSFMRSGSIINGDGRYMQRWDTKFIYKGIIESFTNRPVNVLQC